MTTEDKLAQVADNLDRLSQVTNTLAGSVAAHDDQIEALMRVAETHDTHMADMRQAQTSFHQAQAEFHRAQAKIQQVQAEYAENDRRLQARIEAIAEVTNKNSEAIANLEKQWQAYLTTLPRQ